MKHLIALVCVGLFVIGCGKKEPEISRSSSRPAGGRPSLSNPAPWVPAYPSEYIHLDELRRPVKQQFRITLAYSSIRSHLVGSDTDQVLDRAPVSLLAYAQRRFLFENGRLVPTSTTIKPREFCAIVVPDQNSANRITLGGSFLLNSHLSGQGSSVAGNYDFAWVSYELLDASSRKAGVLYCYQSSSPLTILGPMGFRFRVSNLQSALGGIVTVQKRQ